MVEINKPEPKFCVNCQHYRQGDFHGTRPGEFAMCQRPVGINLTTGAVKTADSFCSTQREIQGHCGHTARYFMQKLYIEEKVLDKIEQKCYTGIVEKIVRWFKK